jgi:flavin-binding protein dodecin
MPDKTYKIVDVVGVSEEGIHQAVRNALKKASQTLRNLEWFEVQNIRGAVKGRAGVPGKPQDWVSSRRRSGLTHPGASYSRYGRDSISCVSRGSGFERGTRRGSRRIGPETGLVYKAEGGGTEDRDR